MDKRSSSALATHMRSLRPRWLAARCFGVLLLVAPAFAQPSERGESAPGADPETTPAGSPGLTADVRRIEDGVLRPALDRLVDEHGDIDAVARDPRLVRELWARGQEEAARAREDLARRRALVRELEARLEATLAARLEGPDAALRAREAVERARELHRKRRVVELHEGIKCSCPKENWTRSLAACFEDCANGQKNLIDRWLDAGYTNDEIRRRMVEAEGPEVLVEPRSAAAVVAPYAIFVVAGALVAWLLWRFREPRARRRGEKDARGVGEEPSVDPEWEARLERELRTLDD